MDINEKEKVLRQLADDAWWLYATAIRIAREIPMNGEETVLNNKQHIKALNSKIASVMIDINNVVDEGILSHESIESKIIKKLEEKGDN